MTNYALSHNEGYVYVAICGAEAVDERRFQAYSTPFIVSDEDLELLEYICTAGVYARDRPALVSVHCKVPASSTPPVSYLPQKSDLTGPFIFYAEAPVLLWAFDPQKLRSLQTYLLIKKRSRMSSTHLPNPFINGSKA